MFNNIICSLKHTENQMGRTGGTTIRNFQSFDFQRLKIFVSDNLLFLVRNAVAICFEVKLTPFYVKNMIYVAIVIWAIGMLLIWVGRIYVSIQKEQGNPKFQDEEYVRKFDFWKRIISICLVLIAVAILFLMGK
ncbi:MAG: hypothetical protein J1E38_03235 [Paramuribaculum sp.]|nr:hypothetical protein [Paramuribaculum sp.]